ncbi:hypothetical protein MAR_027964, partial [Mya arenaria]
LVTFEKLTTDRIECYYVFYVLAPIDDVFISSPKKNVVVLHDSEELIVKCECLDGIPKATFEWSLDNATNGNKTDDKLVANDNGVSLDHQFQNGTTVGYIAYKAKPSESGMRLYCVARTAVNELKASNSVLLAITEKGTFISFWQAALLGGIFGALILDVALGCGATCFVLNFAR